MIFFTFRYASVKKSYCSGPNTTLPMDFSYIIASQSERGGFDFTNLRRNETLYKAAGPAGASSFPRARKTGTTICGVITKDAVVLGADTRATEGPIVADKACQKLHRLADNIWTAGAGTAADLDHTTVMMESRMELTRLATGRTPRVASAVSQLSQMLFRYQGHISCALVLGGVDCKGPQLFKIHPHGSTDRLPFCAMGSGSLNALAVLEAGFKDDMTVSEGQALVADAIRAGIYNDLGSGGNVDIVTITKDGMAKLSRGYDQTNASRLTRNPKPVTFHPGTTPVLTSHVKQLWKTSVVVEDVEMTSVGTATAH